MNEAKTVEYTYMSVLENLESSRFNLLVSEEQEVIMQKVSFLIRSPELTDYEKRLLSNAVKLLNKNAKSKPSKPSKKQELPNSSSDKKLPKIHFKEFSNLDTEYKAFVHW